MKIHTQYKLVFDTTHRIAACSTVGMRELWRHVAFFAYEQAIGVVIGAARSSRAVGQIHMVAVSHGPLPGSDPETWKSDRRLQRMEQ